MNAKRLFQSAIFVTAGLLAVVATGCTGEVASGTLGKAQKDGNIYIGDIPFEAPLLYQKNQQMVGPEAKLAEKIAELVGKEVGAQVVPFWIKRDNYAALAPALENGEVDFIISAYGINDQRNQELSFSKPYYKSELVMIVNPVQNHDLDPSQLSGRTVAVREGTVAAEKVRAKFPDAQVVDVATIDDGVLAVRRGEAAAMIADRYMLAFSLATLTGAQGLEIIDEVLDTVDVGIAVRKEETRVLELVNRAVDEMMGQNYLAALNEELAQKDYQAVLQRRSDRIEREEQAKKPRDLTFRVQRASGSDFDIYRFANLRFFLIDVKSGKQYRSTLIDFQGRVGVCRAQVVPGNYRLVVQKFDFSPGNIVITASDKQRVTINLTVESGPSGPSFRLTRGD